jgi:hypothetical protein
MTTRRRAPADDEFDATLVGLIALDDPRARDVDESWIAAPRWREAARALLAHRRRGGALGDLLTTADVLVNETVLYLPRTTAADAVLAAHDLVVDVPTFLREARVRAVRLQLHRAAFVIEMIAGVTDPDVIPQHVERVRADLATITGHAPAPAPARRVAPIDEFRSRRGAWS